MKNILQSIYFRIFTGKKNESFEKQFVFVIPAFNCKKWFKRNLDSVFSQKCPNWRIIYIDDCSTDGTGPLVENYISKKGFQDKVTLIQNKERNYALCNIYHAVHSCKDNEIVAILDGDDWLAHKNVLTVLNKTYSNPNIWVTYGNYICKPGNYKSICRDITPEEIQNNMFREIDWRTSHLKTFYAWLFKRIKKEDLFFDGNFFTITYDLAIMFPMLEMAANKIKYISEIIYIYNIANPLNDGISRRELQQKIVHVIRNMSKYKQLQ